MFKRGYLQISFSWIFALIVGVFILFLAVFLVVKLIDTSETESGYTTSKQLGNVLNVLESGFESGTSTSLDLPVETTIYNGCSSSTENGIFGIQRISVSEASLKSPTRENDPVIFRNKYIFSTREITGKKLFVFTKPFEFPFKVTDLIFLIPISERYCFIEAPEDIEDEVKDLGKDNLLVENCSSLTNVKRVCFSNSGRCDIRVNTASQSVQKTNSRGDLETMYFEGDALMYAAIFSDKGVYDCQVQRLMLRVSSLADLYVGKASIIAQEGCNSNLNQELMQLKSLALGVESSGLTGLKSVVESLENKNRENSKCKLW